MNELHRLVTRREAISAETVQILDKFLQMAKRGEIVSAMIVGLGPDGTAHHEGSASDQQVTMLGAVSRLLHRMQINADMAESPL